MSLGDSDHPETWSSERFVLWVLLAMSSAHVSVLFFSDLLPFVDLPFHLAAATVLREYGSLENQFSDYFSLQIVGQPNVFHLWFCSRSIFPSVEIANKVFFSLYAFSMPLSVLGLIRKIGGNPWFALLSFIYLYNFSTHYGFVGFVAGIPVLIALFTLTLRHFEAPGKWTYLLLLLGSVALFFIHVLALLFFLFAFGLICLTQRSRPPRCAYRSLLLMVPALGVIAWWWSGNSGAGGESLSDSLIQYYGVEYLPSLKTRALLFIRDNAFLAEGRPGLIWGTSLAAASLFFVVWAGLFERGALLSALRGRQRQLLAIVILAAALCFFLLPEGLPGQWALSQRYGVILALVLIAWSSAIALRRIHPSYVIAGILCAVLLHFGAYLDYFRAFREESIVFTDQILPEAGSEKLGSLIIDPYFRGTQVYLHFADYFIVRRHSIAVSHMSDFRFGTIRRKRSVEEIPRAFKRFDHDLPYDGAFDNLDWVIVRGDIPPELRSLLGVFRDAKRAGPWTLLEASPGPDDS